MGRIEIILTVVGPFVVVEGETGEGATVIGGDLPGWGGRDAVATGGVLIHHFPMRVGHQLPIRTRLPVETAVFPPNARISDMFVLAQPFASGTMRQLLAPDECSATASAPFESSLPPTP